MQLMGPAMTESPEIRAEPGAICPVSRSAIPSVIGGAAMRGQLSIIARSILRAIILRSLPSIRH